MIERGMIFNGEMVRAILDGRKSRLVITWRVRKAQNKKRMKAGTTMTIRQIAIKPGCEKLFVNYVVLSLTTTLRLTTPFMTLIGLKAGAHGMFATA
ncbi:TPA: hypothetical protein OUA98_002855 [Klebsiella michiganensis]|nr:hypothetical protein [Klebsiella michiganensis]